MKRFKYDTKGLEDTGEPDIDAWLNKLGEDGWELVSLEAEDQVFGIFKQEIPNDLTAAAADLLAASKLQHEAIDLLFARLIALDKTFLPSKSGKPWEALQAGNKARDKAEGKS